MAEQKNPQAQPELSLSEQTRIRREKLTNLQAEGQNPFVITRFDQYIAEIICVPIGFSVNF